jgi:hypothetical protein
MNPQRWGVSRVGSLRIRLRNRTVNAGAVLVRRYRSHTVCSSSNEGGIRGRPAVACQHRVGSGRRVFGRTVRGYVADAELCVGQFVDRSARVVWRWCERGRGSYARWVPRCPVGSARGGNLHDFSDGSQGPSHIHRGCRGPGGRLRFVSARPSVHRVLPPYRPWPTFDQ